MMVHSVGYTAFCYVISALCMISAMLCLILILAMILPLLSPQRRKKYSTYNLYLAFLTIPDLIPNLFVLALVFGHHQHDSHYDMDMHMDIDMDMDMNMTEMDHSQMDHSHHDHSQMMMDHIQHHDLENSEQTHGLIWMFEHPFDHNIFALCVTANLYTSAFLVCEIFRLLQDSNQRKRHTPPSILKVTRHAMVSYGLGIFIFLVEYGVSGFFERNSGRNTKIWFGLYQAFSFIFVVLIPLLAMVTVSVKIHLQGLVGSTGSMYQGRLRILVIYFARIVASYLLVWMPASVAYMVSWSSPVNRTKEISFAIFLFFASFQPIVNFGCSLTKPDARNLILSLLKCEYCWPSDEEAGNGRRSSSIHLGSNVDPYLGRLSVWASSGAENSTEMINSTEMMESHDLSENRAADLESDVECDLDCNTCRDADDPYLGHPILGALGTPEESSTVEPTEREAEEPGAGTEAEA